MESTKYLWLVTSELKPSKTYIYLNEEGDKIVGNSVSDSNTVSPYSCASGYFSASSASPFNIPKLSIKFIII